MLKGNYSKKGISVLMPTYNQGPFISRSIKSLFLQTFQQWELIIINDGCTDYTEEVIRDYLSDTRIKYFKQEQNKGLGFSLNKGIQHASFNFIAYLPSDDIYFKDHLQTLYNVMVADEELVLAYSGMMHNYTSGNFSHAAQDSFSTVNGHYQLVQVIHKKTDDKWMERISNRRLKYNVLGKAFKKRKSTAYSKNYLRMDQPSGAKTQAYKRNFWRWDLYI